MTRDVLLSERARRDFGRLPESARSRIRRALFEFAATGRADVKRLAGIRAREDLFRLRIGEYRIVFAVTATDIRVTRIIPRGEGYPWL